MRKLFIAMILVLFSVSCSAMTFEVGTGYFSQYVFRGQRLIDSPVLTPSVSLCGENIELKATKVYDADKKDYYKDEYQLTFKTEIDNVGVDFGFIRHDLANAGVDTNEFFVKAELRKAWKPTFAVYFDVEKGSGQYLQAGLERNLTSGKNAIAFGGRFSYLLDNGYMGTTLAGKEFSGAYNGELYLVSKFNIGKHIVAEPMIGYTFPLSGESKGAIKRLSVNNKENTLYGGVTLTTVW